MTASDFASETKELDARNGDGIDVRLFWNADTETVSVSVFDASHEQRFELPVEPADARDAFNHPFAYAAYHGIPFATPLRAHDEQSVAA